MPKGVNGICGRSLAGSPHKSITVHRYHPRDDLGGTRGVLNFEASNIEALIEKGFVDTVNHNGSEAGFISRDGQEA
jgi:hypothetical protein